MTMGTGIPNVGRTVTVQVDTGSLAWKFYTMAEDYERLKHTFDLCSQTTDRQRERIAALERENAALWEFVKATDAIGTAMTANDREAALDAAEAATEARAALNDLRGDR